MALVFPSFLPNLCYFPTYLVPAYRLYIFPRIVSATPLLITYAPVFFA